MAKSTDFDSTVQALVSTFASRLSETLVAGMNAAMATAAITTEALPAKKGPGRPPKAVHTAASGATSPTPAKRGPGRPPSTTGKTCLVPACGKKAIAKGLCQSHYRKATRLKLKKFDAASLAKLKQDGRATRWAKKR
jgi:hypothetical protein